MKGSIRVDAHLASGSWNEIARAIELTRVRAEDSCSTKTASWSPKAEEHVAVHHPDPLGADASDQGASDEPQSSS